MQPPSSRRAPLPGLTGYRFVLAAMVLCGHAFYGSQIYRDGPLLDSLAILSPLAFAAVSSFFVLSGFVLTWSAPAGDTRALFWRRRFVKIYPNHLLTWALTLAILLLISAPSPVLGFRDDPGYGGALTNLLLVQNWFRVPDYVAGMNAVSWSICCEAFFYLAFPFLLGPILRLREDRLWRWTGTVAALILLVPVPTFLLDGPDFAWWAPLPLEQMWVVYTMPPVRLLEFVLGMLAARLVIAGRWPRLRLRWAVVPAVVAILLAPALPVAYVLCAAYALPFGLLVPTLATRDLDGRTRWLRTPRMLALGSASYALYLVHYPLLVGLRNAIGADRRFDPVPATLLILAFLLIAVSASLLLYRYWELPIMRRYSRPRRPVAAVPPPPAPAPVPGPPAAADSPGAQEGAVGLAEDVDRSPVRVEP